MEDLPTEFRGCLWDEHWEFDAPFVVYFPKAFRRAGIGGNSAYIDEAIEDITIDISMGKRSNEVQEKSLARECEFRRWDIDGFAKRKEAWHVSIKGRWEEDEYEDLVFVQTERKEQFGSFKRNEEERWRGA